MTNESIKSKFTSDEWFKVMTGLGQAGTAVMAASPSGVTGLVAEMSAIVKGVREEVAKEPRSGLQEAIAADLMAGPPQDMPKDEQGRIKNAEEAVERSLEAVRQAVWLVDSKLSPEDAQSYRDMLRTIAERVAQAAKEGGFLGMGGEQVSAKEQDVLTQLNDLLGQGGAASDQTAIPSAPRTDDIQPNAEGGVISPNPDGSGTSV